MRLQHVGSDDGGAVNATFTTLLARAQLCEVEPWSYLRDVFCLLPTWPEHELLDLALSASASALRLPASAVPELQVEHRLTLADAARRAQSREYRVKRSRRDHAHA